jgi:hypothetical protein
MLLLVGGEMQRILTIVFILSVFGLGWVCSSMFALVEATGAQQPFGLSQSLLDTPADRVSEKDIHVFDDKIILDIKNASWASFTPTHSMEPLLSEKAHGIEVKPTSSSNLEVGDVISYNSDFTTGLVIHRIIETGYDDKGWYAIVKGDNNSEQDPGKVRFDDINGVLIGVIY